MNKLRAIWLILITHSFFLQTEDGYASHIPADPAIYAELIESCQSFIDWLQDQEIEYFNQETN